MDQNGAKIGCRSGCPRAGGRPGLDPLRTALFLVLPMIAGCIPALGAAAAQLRAGAAKVDVTDAQSRAANDRLHVRALVLDDGATRAAVVAVDAVAIGEIGPIGNGYLPRVRSRLENELGIKPANLLVNASHCHGLVRSDVDEKTVQAVKEAVGNLVAVKV